MSDAHLALLERDGTVPKAKSSGFVFKQVRRWFIKVAWPWIVKNVWPELRRMVVELIEDAFAGFLEKLQEWISQRGTKADSAQAEAEAAEAKARAATSEAEAEKLRAVAQVWRQVAEERKHENDALRAKLDELVRDAVSDVRIAVEELNIDNLVEEGEDASLRLKGSQKALDFPSSINVK